MTGVIKNQEKIVCPHCGHEQEDCAEDYVVAGQTGAASKCEELCAYCDELFVAQRVNADEIMVTFNDPV